MSCSETGGCAREGETNLHRKYAIAIQALVFLLPSVLGFDFVSQSICSAGRAEEPVRLTFDGRHKRDPIVWPDGKSITFSTVTDDGISRVMRLNLDDGSLKLFHANEQLPDRELTVSADGAAYAHVYVTPDGQRGRVIVTRATSKITLEPARFGLWPTLSPDGKHLAFTIDAGPIVSVDLDRLAGTNSIKIEPKSGEAIRRLSYDNTRYGDLWPRFSPDGRSIVFSSRRDDDYEIYVMNSDGSNQRRLTNQPGIDAHPSFSPDGKHIVFTSSRDQNYEIYTMLLDGTQLQRITHHPERDDYASWYPDGKRLLIVSQRQGQTDLYSLAMPP